MGRRSVEAGTASACTSTRNRQSTAQNPKLMLIDMLLPGKLICWAPFIKTVPPSENPESDRRKFGEAMLPMGLALLMMLNTLLTRRLKLRVCLGGFLFFLSSLKPKVFEMDELKEKLPSPRPRFRGMIVSPGSGFGSRIPYGVDIKPGLVKSVANEGRSV